MSSGWVEIENELIHMLEGHVAATEASLDALVAKASARVEGAPSNATSLLYAGDIKGQQSFEVSKALTTSTGGETSTGSGLARKHDAPVPHPSSGSWRPSIFSRSPCSPLGMQYHVDT